MSAIASDTDPREWGGATRQKAKRLPLGSKRFVAPPERCEVREGAQPFLRDHPELKPFLDETIAKVREYFGQETALSIEGVMDPEDESASLELYVRVKTSLRVKAAREILERFEEAWWLRNKHRGGFLIHVTLEFA